MAIYRGPGGAGDATNDATSESIISVEAAAAAQASATAAASSASGASTSATNAATSATNAANSATAAQTAETNAETAQIAAEAAQVAAEDARDATLNFGDSLTVQATTLSAGSSATVSYDSNDLIIDFGIPTGATGATGPANTLSIGTVSSGSTAAATITGTAPNQTLNLTLPKGDTGTNGTNGAAATIAVGSVTTGAAGSSATVTNSGTSSSAVFDFSIPRGATGSTGATGATGTAATIAVGTVTTGAAGSAATVTNSGTSSAAVFNFSIPKGADGAGSGTVTSVGMSVPTGLSVTGSPITSSGTLAVSLQSGYAIPTTASQTNWDTAYTDRNKWDGGATGLVAATGRTSLGLGTIATLAAPAGTVVGTTDTQTLTNKTIGMAGALDCNNNVIQEIKTATFNSQTTIATTTGAITVDWTSAQNQKQTEPTGTITYTFTAPIGPCHLQLIIDSDGTSTAQTINWPGTVVWMGSTWAGTNNKKAVINFWYDGTNYFVIGTNQV